MSPRQERAPNIKKKMHYKNAPFLEFPSFVLFGYRIFYRSFLIEFIKSYKFTSWLATYSVVVQM